jgi:hypothetical protein
VPDSTPPPSDPWAPLVALFGACDGLNHGPACNYMFMGTVPGPGAQFSFTRTRRRGGTSPSTVRVERTSTAEGSFGSSCSRWNLARFWRRYELVGAFRGDGRRWRRECLPHGRAPNRLGSSRPTGRDSSCAGKVGAGGSLLGSANEFRMVSGTRPPQMLPFGFRGDPARTRARGATSFPRADLARTSAVRRRRLRRRETQCFSQATADPGDRAMSTPRSARGTDRQ